MNGQTNNQQATALNTITERTIMEQQMYRDSMSVSPMGMLHNALCGATRTYTQPVASIGGGVLHRTRAHQLLYITPHNNIDQTVPLFTDEKEKALFYANDIAVQYKGIMTPNYLGLQRLIMKKTSDGWYAQTTVELAMLGSLVTQHPASARQSVTRIDALCMLLSRLLENKHMPFGTSHKLACVGVQPSWQHYGLTQVN